MKRLGDGLHTMTRGGVNSLPYSYRTKVEPVALRYSLQIRISTNIVLTSIRIKADAEGILH